MAGQMIPLAAPYAGEQLTQQDRRWLQAVAMFGIPNEPGEACHAAQLLQTVWARLELTEDLLQAALDAVGKATL